MLTGRVVSSYREETKLSLASVLTIFDAVKPLTKILGVVIFPVPCKVRFLLVAKRALESIAIEFVFDVLPRINKPVPVVYNDTVELVGVG